MKRQTKHLTGQVREALLALPDAVLMETLAQWLDSIDEQFLDWSDECRSALGYRIQSDETHKLYASFEELEQAEPDGAGASWMVPDAQTLRTTLRNLSLEQFYHSVIALAGEALALQASEEAWGFPPSGASDGYDFMRCLTVHLRYKALRRPEQGHISFPQQAAGRRKPMKPSSSGQPGWRLRSSRHRERTASSEHQQRRQRKSDSYFSEKRTSTVSCRHVVCFFLPFKTSAVDALASPSPDASTAALLGTQGTTSPGGQRQSVSPPDWSTDMIQ